MGSNTKNINLILGDCKEKLAELPKDSIDLMATDPPYGYSFMGKDWDKAVVSVDAWRECLRVLKPGAFAFVMSAPRQDVLSHMIVNLEKAGFDISFTSIYWTYASGFPKASNVGKMADKKAGTKRKIIGKGNRHSGRAFGAKAGDSQYGTYKGGVPPITKGKSLLEGSYAGFQPKPAVEVIIVCMKPLSEKLYLRQALKNKKGITWLDDCRVPYTSSSDMESARFGTQMDIRGNNYMSPVGVNAKNVLSSTKGRFPANLLVSDDALNDGKISMSGRDAVRRQEGYFIDHKLGGKSKKQVFYPDSGSFSRYFSLDAWWAEKTKNLSKDTRKTFPFLIIPKASRSEKNRGLKNNKNFHPTVKPIKLFSYLITLGSRPGDSVLDSYMGTGTTGIDAKMLNRKFIGIELNKDYFEIATQRIKSTQKNLL